MADDLLATIGSRIQEARKEAGFRNAESLAVALGVGVRTVQRWEAGHGEPSLHRLNQIGALTEKPLAYFLEKAAA